MKELRSHLNYDQFRSLVAAAQQADQYQLFMALQNDVVIGAMGLRILFDLVHGKHLYVDDLVTTEKCRSTGVGAALLTHAEQMAQAMGCQSLRLCTGITNDRGRQFYERQGWAFKSVVYKKAVGPTSLG